MLSKILKMSVVMTVMCLWRLYSEFEVIQEKALVKSVSYTS